MNINIARWHTDTGDKTRSHVLYNKSSICGLLSVGRREMEILFTFSPSSESIPPVECKRCEKWLVNYLRRYTDWKKTKAMAAKEPVLNGLVKQMERKL